MRGVLHCCLVLRDDGGTQEALRFLEDLESESSELASLAERLSIGEVSPERAPTHDIPWGLLGLLDAERMEGMDDPDVGLRLAAVEDLRRLVDRYPRDPDCCFAYAFGLLTRRPIEELAGYVDHLATLEEPRHTFHYNYGQLLIAVGERDRGLRHLHRSLELASNQEETADATEIISRFAEP